MSIYLFSVITAVTFSVALLPPSTSIAKPSIPKPNLNKPPANSNISNLGDGIKFTFQGCTQIPSQEKVICLGNFRSSNGERFLRIYRNEYASQTTITDTQGKSYSPVEIRVGGDYICNDVGASDSSDCRRLNVTLVENVDYKTVLTFNNVSLPSPKIPLLSIVIYKDGERYLKYRNIPVSVNGADLSNGQSQSRDNNQSTPVTSLRDSSEPKVNNQPSEAPPANGLLENLVIRGLNDLFGISNQN
jgi:hypothetical protein